MVIIYLCSMYFTSANNI